jgi:hypothetical protein
VGLAAELEASLREFLAAGAAEILENGSRVTPSAALSWEVRGASEKPLLHLWSEQCNLTRRVLAITDHSDKRLALAVERFGRSKPDRLEFLRLDFERSPRDLFRKEFCSRLRLLLAEQFPDETLESLTIAPDLEHSLSGNYARGLLLGKGKHTAFLAVPGGESADTIENSLTFALLWLHRARQSSSRSGAAMGLRLILSKGEGRFLAHRFAALDPRIPVELYERDSALDRLEKIDPRSAGNVDSWLVSRRESQSLLDQTHSVLRPVVALAPHAITVHPVPQSHEVWLRFRGLAFARCEQGRLFFGKEEAWKELTAATQPALQRLIHDLEVHRHPLASDTRHIFFRSQAERWLESLVREDVSRIDAALDARYVYAQVFAHAGGEHGILDLLTITRSGRLAILELKASEYIHLPLQAAEYWLRIRRHLAQGDFSKYGFFPGVELQAAPPLVYLVAPALRFHSTTDTLLRFLTPELEFVRVGLAESWRHGLRIVLRH